jgi:hypothetical protein
MPIPRIVEAAAPSPTDPPGTLTWRGLGKALLATLISSGLVYAALALIGTEAQEHLDPGIGAAVAGAVKFMTTILKMYYGGPSQPVVVASAPRWTGEPYDGPPVIP